MPATPWDQLPLPEKVEQLHRDLEELIRVERANVDARNVQRRDFEMRMVALEEAQIRIEARMKRLEDQSSELDPQE